MKKKIAVVCPHPEGVAPGQRLKYEQYFQYWQDDGWIVDVYPFQTKKFWDIAPKRGKLLDKIFWTLYGYWLRVLTFFQLRNYDIVYVFLWVTPFGPPLFEWLYRKMAKRIIYDIDDLVYMGKASDPNSWISRLKGKNKPIYLMKHADHVITCTPYLDNFVRCYNQSTTDISSTIQTDQYQILDKNNSEDRLLILGWSGSHSTAKYLYLLEPVLLKLYKEIPFKLIVMGTDDFHIDGLDIESFTWREDIEISTIQSFDIGLYPLPDDEWVHGKSGLKAIQYMACGVPTVASKIGEAICRVIDDKVDGFLVYDEDEWYTQVLSLMRDPSLRKEMGQRAREKVVKHYSIDANKNTYLNILNTVAAIRAIGLNV